MNAKQKALYQAMSDISEDCYCAGWHDDHDEPGLDVDSWGPRFIPMQDWLELYAQHRRSGEGPTV